LIALKIYLSRKSEETFDISQFHYAQVLDTLPDKLF